MSLNQVYQATVAEFSSSPQDLIRYQHLIPSLTDLTLLDKQATDTKIKQLAQWAEENKVASVCIYPEHLEHLPTQFSLAKAIVINFPEGQLDTEASLNAIDKTLAKHDFEEVDIVFPYRAYLAGQEKEALAFYQRLFSHCQQKNLTCKMILETGAFTDAKQLHHLACQLLASNPCDFLKTSTGKTQTGATPFAAFCLLQAMLDTQVYTGIKISGGIRTFEQAQTYLQLAKELLKKEVTPQWFRFGASSLVLATCF